MFKSIPLEEILVENSTYNRVHLKKRLIEIGLLENLCSHCGLGPEWNDKILVLQLEHINGINNDNRLENLTLLCPNCHSQTATFAGKKFYHCIDCQASIKKHSTRCKSCASRHRSVTKIDWPSKEELLARLSMSNYSALARELGVSDNAIRNHLK